SRAGPSVAWLSVPGCSATSRGWLLVRSALISWPCSVGSRNFAAIFVTPRRPATPVGGSAAQRSAQSWSGGRAKGRTGSGPPRLKRVARLDPPSTRTWIDRHDEYLAGHGAAWRHIGQRSLGQRLLSRSDVSDRFNSTELAITGDLWPSAVPRRGHRVSTRRSFGSAFRRRVDDPTANLHARVGTDRSRPCGGGRSTSRDTQRICGRGRH